MIFRTNLNPRDYDGYYDMISKLQEICIAENGARFDTTKIAMGQIQVNGEICWFEGFVDDEEIEIFKRKQFEQNQLRERYPSGRRCSEPEDLNEQLVKARKLLKDNGHEVFIADSSKAYPAMKIRLPGLPWSDQDLIAFAEYIVSDPQLLIEGFKNRRLEGSGHIPGSFQRADTVTSSTVKRS